MDKSYYLKMYRQPKIRVWFNDDNFMSDPSLSISEERISSEELMDFFVPRTKKNGTLDDRGIEEKVRDSNIALITVREAVKNPVAWDLAIDEMMLPTTENMLPIPIATNIQNGRTLLLDSNHCVVTILSKATGTFTLSVVRLQGDNLENIIEDFKILNRQ